MKNSDTGKENGFIKFIRILLGLTFIFSSTVKGIDPVGTSYRVEDYLLAYGLTGLTSLSLAIAILVITSEFILGFALLFKLKYKTALRFTLLLMLFFTVVTWFDAKYNLVPDCGCFGDAVKLSNQATFYKNIVLLVMTLLLLVVKKGKTNRLPSLIQYLILLIASVLFVTFELYNYNHLPVYDFRDWKTGKDMKVKNLDKEKIYLTYKNKKTGEEKEYLSPNYPWQDSAWRADWTFVGKRIDDSQVIKPHKLAIEDKQGNDVTKQVIENPGFQIVIISYDLTETNGEGMIKATELYDSGKLKNVYYALITATEPNEVEKFKKLYDINFPVYFADETELKSVIRSNPGMILLHNGVILKKWHFNDFPDVTEIKKLITR